MLLTFSSYYPPFFFKLFSYHSPPIHLLLSSPSPPIILFSAHSPLSLLPFLFSPIRLPFSSYTPPPFISYYPSVLLLYSSVSPLQSRFSLKISGFQHNLYPASGRTLVPKIGLGEVQISLAIKPQTAFPTSEDHSSEGSSQVPEHAADSSGCFLRFLIRISSDSFVHAFQIPVSANPLIPLIIPISINAGLDLCTSSY